ncbi:MAG: DNA recombination protein RmuC, partial [Alphaproteobacteria bacterium]
ADTDQARKDAATRFERHVSNHLKDIAAKYIVPGQTADQALMFLPSEAVFGCLHCDFRRVVELSHRLKVWIVSPATFAALLTTLRAVLRDSLLSSNIDQVQSEIDHLSKDLEALSQNLEAFDRHFSLLGQDLERMHKLTSTLQIRSHRIGETSVAAPTRKPPVSREIKQKSTGSDSYSGRSIPISMVQ